MKTNNWYHLLIGTIIMCLFANAQSGFVYAHLRHSNQMGSPLCKHHTRNFLYYQTAAVPPWASFTITAAPLLIS